MAVEHHESDGIGEAIEELLRTGLLLGARLAERHAHAREQALHEAARHSLGQARAEQQRQRAEREQALAGLEGVFSGSWWEHAGAEDIRCAWTTARSYQHEDAHAARGVWRIADELKQRYGLDAFQNRPGGARHPPRARAPHAADQRGPRPLRPRAGQDPRAA